MSSVFLHDGVISVVVTYAGVVCIGTISVVVICIVVIYIDVCYLPSNVGVSYAGVIFVCIFGVSSNIAATSGV